MVTRKEEQKPQESPNFVRDVTQHSLENEDVQLHWCLVGCDWEKEEAEALLQEVVKLWVTIRGFSYASAWVEKFKSTGTKSLQKSKGLRKKLIAKDSK